MEIERKYLVKKIPRKIELYRSSNIEQYYISSDPTIRIRRIDGKCVLTVKSKGALAVEEFEMTISPEAFDNLKLKTEGYGILKTRYYVPLRNGYIAELDIYAPPFDKLTTVEVEFPSIEAAEDFEPPEWFGNEVTYDFRYKNSSLAANGPGGIKTELQN